MHSVCCRGRTLGWCRAISEVCVLLLSPVTVGLYLFALRDHKWWGGEINIYCFFRSKKSLVLLVSEQWGNAGVTTVCGTRTSVGVLGLCGVRQPFVSCRHSPLLLLSLAVQTCTFICYYKFNFIFPLQRQLMRNEEGTAGGYGFMWSVNER